MATTTQGDFGDLSAETEAIEVTSNLPRTMKSWRYTDQQGHEHYWRDNGYPTLKRVVDGREWDDDLEDWYEASHLECPLCGETIIPGTTIDTFRRFAPGLTTYKLNGELITKERYEEILAARRVTRTAITDE